MKAITPVIAIILLLLIVIAVAGFTAVFLQDTVAGTSETVEQAANTQTSTKTQFVEFVASGENTITIKNVGTSDISEITVLIDGSPVAAASPGVISPGKTGTFTLNEAELAVFPGNSEITIISGGNIVKTNKSSFLSANTVGYWTFNDLDKGKQIIDYSGNNNHGTFQGTVYDGTLGDGTCTEGIGSCPSDVVNSHDLKFGKAMSFDGINDKVLITTSPGDPLYFPSGSDVTITLWLKRAAVDGVEGGIIGAGSITRDVMFRLKSDNRIRMEFEDLGDNHYTTPIVDTNWHHLAVVMKSNNFIRAYIDGDEVTNDAVGTSFGGITTGNWFIGHNTACCGNSYFPGQIDEVRVYNKVLNEQEIDQDMNSKYPLKNVVASYSFEYIYDDFGSRKTSDTHFIAQGQDGGALNLNGNEYVDVGKDTSLDISGIKDFTWGVWVKKDADDTWENFLDKGSDWAGFGTHLNGNPDNLFVHFRLADLSFTNWHPLFAPGTVNWNHIALSHQNTEFSAYANGNFIESFDPGQGLYTTINNNLKIGGGSPRYFKGLIDEVRVMNKAIS
jgi:hypothetical protein